MTPTPSHPRRRRVSTAVAAVVAVLLAGPVPAAVADPSGVSPMPAAADLGLAVGSSLVSVDAGSALVASSYPLTEVNPFTGDLDGGRVSGSGDGQSAVVSDLAEQGLLALDGVAAARAAAALADARRAAAATAGGQTEVGPGDCPTWAPAGSLRDGADQVGVYQLCADAVAGAATPAAARAVVWAFSMLGVPYACGGAGRGTDRADCSSLVGRAYHTGAGLAGVNPGITVSNLVPRDGYTPVPGLVNVPDDQARPGDVALIEVCAYSSVRCDPGHVVMLLANGWMLHTNRCGDVAHVRRFYGFDSVHYRGTRRILPT